MTVLTLCIDDLTGIDESLTDPIGDDVRPPITPPMIARRQKINRIRQQLARGTYDLDDRLDAVLERILMDLKQ